MAIEYRLDVRSRAGVLLAQVSDYIELTYTRAVNQPGLATIVLDGNHSVIPLLTNCGQVEIWRRDPDMGMPWYCDFYTLYMGAQHDFGESDVFTMICPGVLTQLSWRYVAWPTGTNNVSSFTNVQGETFMKTIVTNNCGTLALAASGRARDGVMTGLSVRTDQGRGWPITIDCSYQNVLAVLQKNAPICGGDFDLVKIGAQAWEFHFYPGFSGTDRTAVDGVLFSLANDNMTNIRYLYDRTNEKTAAIVGGKGQGAARTLVVRTGPDYDATLNNIEVFVDGRNNDTTAGLSSTGDQLLRDDRAQPTIQFDVVQTPNTLYGLHYFLGDLVRVNFLSTTWTQKVNSVTLDHKPTGEETLKVSMVAPYPPPTP